MKKKYYLCITKNKNNTINLLNYTTMATKRNCENKNYLTAKGFQLRIKNVVNKPRYDQLKQCVQWYIHKVEDGNDLVLYFLDDSYADMIDWLRTRCKIGTSMGLVNGYDYFTWRLDTDNLAVKEVILSTHVPAILEDGETFAECYTRFLQSTTRGEDGKVKTSHRNEYGNDEDIPEIVNMMSFNQYRINGHF